MFYNVVQLRTDLVVTPYQIDPAELHRVYPPVSKTAGNGLQSDTGATDAGLPGELEKWRALAIEREETIRRLWERLDAEAEERRRVQERLTHRSTTSVPAVLPTPTRVPWWHRWFR